MSARRHAATVEGLNGMDREAFIAALDGVFEHSPWIAERAFAHRPFHCIDGLHDAMCRVVEASSPGEQLGLLRAHPELAATRHRAEVLTRNSVDEQ